MEDVPEGTVPGREWNLFGDHLKYLTLRKKNYHQFRLIEMWENADTRDDSDGPKVLFREIKVSEKLFKKFKEMALEEEKSN